MIIRQISPGEVPDSMIPVEKTTTWEAVINTRDCSGILRQELVPSCNPGKFWHLFDADDCLAYKIPVGRISSRPSFQQTLFPAGPVSGT